MNVPNGHENTHITKNQCYYWAFQETFLTMGAFNIKGVLFQSIPYGPYDH